ncbi:MAG: hypothetical protein J4431_01720 [Candidatus Aenigmarchaeota archaeon]|nr:hypothetical protein [Candidatus Aenigmarchaeota archaeon]
MFCIECGKPAESGYICAECLSKKTALKLKSFGIVMCPRCPDGESKAQDEIKETIGKSLKGIKNVKSFEVQTNLKGPVISTVTAAIAMTGGKTRKETKAIRISIRKRLCENCSRLSGNYHEAVLQIRGMQKEEILELVKQMVAPQYLARIDVKKEGYDARIVRKSEAIRIATTLGKEYKVISSFKLAGEKDGKMLYRSVYSIR